MWYNYTPFRWYFADILALIVSVPFFVNLQIVFMRRRYYYIKFIEIAFWIVFFHYITKLLCQSK
jgi:hypothetical protein